MAIINIIYPKNKDEVVSKLRPIVNNADVKYAASENVDYLFEKCHGADIILALQYGDSNSIDYLSDNIIDPIEGVNITALRHRGRLDEVTPLRASVKGATLEDINAMVDVLIPYIEEIVSDASLYSIKRWICDDTGYWRNTVLDIVKNSVVEKYQRGATLTELENLSKAYKTSATRIKGKDYYNMYLFNKDGYLIADPGLVELKNGSFNVELNLSLSIGWVLIEGFYYLFDEFGYSKHETVIDGKIHMLNKYGKLSVDPNLLEIDPNDSSIIHFK